MPYALVKPSGISGLSAILDTEIVIGRSEAWQFEYEYAGEDSNFLGTDSWDQRHEHGGGSYRIRGHVRAGTNFTLSQTLTESVSVYDHVLLACQANNGGTVLTINDIVEHDGFKYLGTKEAKFSYLFRYNTNTNTDPQSFRYLKIWRSGVLTNHWVNTTGTGLVFEDIVGGNDFTLDGSWPAGDDHWVYYDDGAAVTPTLSLPNVTSITASSAVPNVTVTF